MLLSATDRLIQTANTGGPIGLSGEFEAGEGGGCEESVQVIFCQSTIVTSVSYIS